MKITLNNQGRWTITGHNFAMDIYPPGTKMRSRIDHHPEEQWSFVATGTELNGEPFFHRMTFPQPNQIWNEFVAANRGGALKQALEHIQSATQIQTQTHRAA